MVSAGSFMVEKSINKKGRMSKYSAPAIHDTFETSKKVQWKTIRAEMLGSSVDWSVEED